jgi:hypothetical protein
LFKLDAEAAGFDANDGFDFWVVTRLAPEDLDADDTLFEAIQFTGQAPLYDIAKKTRETFRPGESGAFQYRFQCSKNTRDGWLGRSSVRAHSQEL